MIEVPLYEACEAMRYPQRSESLHVHQGMYFKYQQIDGSTRIRRSPKGIRATFH